MVPQRELLNLHSLNDLQCLACSHALIGHSYMYHDKLFLRNLCSFKNLCYGVPPVAQWVKDLTAVAQVAVEMWVSLKKIYVGFCCWLLKILFIFWMQVLYRIWVLQIFSQYVPCIFIHPTVLFEEQTFKDCDEVNLKNHLLGFQLWRSRLMIWIVSMVFLVQSPDQCCGLRILLCCCCGIVHRYGSGSIPGPRTSLCHGCS